MKQRKKELIDKWSKKFATNNNVAKSKEMLNMFVYEYLTLFDDDGSRQVNYDVEVYDSDGLLVDSRYNVLAWNRAEAYRSVMNELKPHKHWDATKHIIVRKQF